ncbi:hypothetical protein ACHAPV_003911 [Trichoderma viride]
MAGAAKRFAATFCPAESTFVRTLVTLDSVEIVTSRWMQSATAGVLRRKCLVSRDKRYSPLMMLKMAHGSTALSAARHLATGSLTAALIAALGPVIPKMSNQLIALTLPMLLRIVHVAKHHSMNSYRTQDKLARTPYLIAREFATSFFLVATAVKLNVIPAIVDSVWKRLRFRVDVGEPHLHPFATREMSNPRGV